MRARERDLLYERIPRYASFAEKDPRSDVGATPGILTSNDMQVERQLPGATSGEHRAVLLGKAEASRCLEFEFARFFGVGFCVFFARFIVRCREV